jgi:hypothetical protein
MEAFATQRSPSRGDVWLDGRFKFRHKAGLLALKKPDLAESFVDATHQTKIPPPIVRYSKIQTHLEAGVKPQCGTAEKTGGGGTVNQLLLLG